MKTPELTSRLAAGLLLTLIATISTPRATSQTLELLHSFFIGVDGVCPTAPLVQAADGKFYGTTYGYYQYGQEDGGSVFTITTNGTFNLVYKFPFFSSAGYCPRAALVEGKDHNLYGTTYLGGCCSDWGAVFKITPGGTLTTLASFHSSDGAKPCAPLCQGGDGLLYGTTFEGGMNGHGVMFNISTNGGNNGWSTRLAYAGDVGGCASGPYAGLTLGSDGNFYGTTVGGGDNCNGSGTVFRMTPGGAVISMSVFHGTNGANPYGGLVLGTDGNFYGTCYNGGASNYGTVFRMTKNRAITTLVSFSGSNGANPRGTLIQGRDGNFYGTTVNGGAGGCGVVFRITASGSLTTLASFDGWPHGSNPEAGLVQGTDGNLYGTAQGGGYSGWGTVFRLVLPFLNVKRSGTKIITSWATNNVGFTLQSSADLSPAAHWMGCTNPPVLSGSQFVVTNSTSGSAQFYRLTK